MGAYYNEHDKFCVEWLKHLMAAGVIAPGMAVANGNFVRHPLADGLANQLGYHSDGDTSFISPLVSETPNRVGRLRGYGNALCGPQAIAFIKAYMETL